MFMFPKLKGDKSQFQYFMALNYLSTYLEFQTLARGKFFQSRNRKEICIIVYDLFFFDEEMNVLLNIHVN